MKAPSRLSTNLSTGQASLSRPALCRCNPIFSLAGLAGILKSSAALALALSRLPARHALFDPHRIQPSSQ